MANPLVPHVGIWRLFIDESQTKCNDFYEIDGINTFGGRRLISDYQTIFAKNENYGYTDMI